MLHPCLHWFSMALEVSPKIQRQLEDCWLEDWLLKIGVRYKQESEWLFVLISCPCTELGIIQGVTCFSPKGSWDRFLPIRSKLARVESKSQLTLTHTVRVFVFTRVELRSCSTWRSSLGWWYQINEDMLPRLLKVWYTVLLRGWNVPHHQPPTQTFIFANS